MTLVNLLIKDFFKASGQHCLIGGITGSGKTQMLYYILDNLLKYHPKEKIIWFDTGKSGEILRLATFKPLRIFIPQDQEYNRDIEFQFREKELDIEKFPYYNLYEVFDNLITDRINVISLEPFYQEEEKGYSKILNKFFIALFRRAMNYSLNPPIAIFIDELHNVAPSNGNSFNDDHMQAGVRFQRNIERLRSTGIRIIGTTQDSSKLRRGVRTAFQWIIIKRGMSFSERDLPMLAKYKEKWWNLKLEHSVWVFPDRSFYENFIKTPFYGDGRKLGRVYYKEELKKPLPLPLPSPEMGTLTALHPSCTPESISLH